MALLSFRSADCSNFGNHAKSPDSNANGNGCRTPLDSTDPPKKIHFLMSSIHTVKGSIIHRLCVFMPITSQSKRQGQVTHDGKWFLIQQLVAEPRQPAREASRFHPRSHKHCLSCTPATIEPPTDSVVVVDFFCRTKRIVSVGEPPRPGPPMRQRCFLVHGTRFK